MRQRSLVDLTSIVVLALKAGAPSSPKGLPVVAALIGSATGQSHSGQTTIASGGRCLFQQGMPAVDEDRQRASFEPKTQATLYLPHSDWIRFDSLQNAKTYCIVNAILII